MDVVSPTRRQLIAASAAGLLATAFPRLALVQESTPSALGQDDGSLPAMLARAPDPASAGGSGPKTLFTYANIARQLEVRGLRSLDPAMEDEDRFSEWADGADGLYADDILLRFTRTRELWGAVGFGPADVTQTMVIGDSPQITRIYRGSFDGDRIRAALAQWGYERVETDRGPVMSIGRNGELDMGGAIVAALLNAYNNIAVVDDAHVIASPFLASVEAAMAVFAGDGASLAENRAVDTLTSAVGEELVSAVVLDGRFLSAGSLPDFTREGVATPGPDATIPPAVSALFGITPGSMPSRYTDEDNQLQGDNDDTLPRSAFVIGLHLGSEAEAAPSAPVIEARLAQGRSVVTGQAYADLLGEPEVEAVPGEPVVKLRFTGDRVGRIWLQAVFSLDLAFIYTE